MRFSYNWLQSFFNNKKLPKPKKLAELLTMHSFEVEGIEKKGRDWALDIDILSNRGHDCLSHIGVAREIGALIKSKIRNQKPKIQIKNQKYNTKDFINVQVKDRQACSRYTARVVTDVKVGPSPGWMQERLRVCGLQPINNIVDVTNYIMLETGQPLHAFDFDKISGVQSQKSEVKTQKQRLKIKNIIVRKAKKGEKIISLDDKEYVLDEDILVIADQKGPLAIAGIKGGKKAEISKSTTTIVLESANFDMKTIRNARQKLGLQTDASLRFEHQPDPNLTLVAIDKAVEFIQKIAKGKVAKGVIDFYPNKVLAKKIRLDLNYVEKLLGIKIPKKEIINILKRLEFQVKEIDFSLVDVKVPSFRQDIALPEDLVEEVGRLYGYEKIPSVLPLATLIPPKRNDELFWQDISKNILKELGFCEVYNYSFISEAQAKIFGCSLSDLIEIENPISIEQKYLRPSLIPNLLKVLRENLRHFKQIRIFELGKIFRCKAEEKKMLTGLITGEFYELKGMVDFLLQGLGISSVWYDEYQATPEDSEISIWHPQKCAEIKVDNTEIGFLGEMHPRVIEKLELGIKPVVFDLDFEKLVRLASEEHEYQPISPYPAAVRDIAILVPLDVKVAEVLNKINTAGGELVRDVDLFDIYEGRELPEGKKNLAFHIIYQSQEKTLSSEEIDRVHQQIIQSLEQDPEWEVRK